MAQSSDFQKVVRSAAKLQQLVPDMVLVGGSAAALHAGHRVSLDHDHVLGDLAERYEAVVDAVKSSWLGHVSAGQSSSNDPDGELGRCAGWYPAASPNKAA